ncbi:hypothetical protein [Candidatus Chlorohelix sp.]|uniref:hypothetical protein n=1 Tax=Candidatus Chlorohelix sp. TaxID=3139201 RepID=UPI003043D4A3
MTELRVAHQLKLVTLEEPGYSLELYTYTGAGSAAGQSTTVETLGTITMPIDTDLEYYPELEFGLPCVRYQNRNYLSPRDAVLAILQEKGFTDINSWVMPEYPFYLVTRNNDQVKDYLNNGAYIRWRIGDRYFLIEVEDREVNYYHGRLSSGLQLGCGDVFRSPSIATLAIIQMSGDSLPVSLYLA